MKENPGAVTRAVMIAGEFPYPEGNASAARIRNLAGGMVECGRRVHVISLWPQLSPPGVAEGQPSTCQGVSYENLNPWSPGNGADLPVRNERLGEKLRWFIRSYSKAGQAARIIGQLASQGAGDLLLIYGRSLIRLWPMIQVANLYNRPVIWDSVEGHHGFSGFLGPLNPIGWDWTLASVFLPKWVDAATVICLPLARMLGERGLKRILVVPPVEDFAQLPPVTAASPQGPFNLLYVGPLFQRDHPEMMLEIMRKLMGLSLPVRLWIAGKYDQAREGKEILRCVQQETGLSQCVLFLGRLSEEQLARTGNQAHGFILLRRNCPAERESFPTRLVEFLKAGKPVFVSEVGDIGRYLKNGIHAVLLDPEDIDQAARAIAQVIRSEDRGYQIGVRGQAQAARCFNRTIHARRIIEFADALVRMG